MIAFEVRTEARRPASINETTSESTAIWQARAFYTASTPRIPNDHAPDEDSSRVLPFGAVENRTISRPSIAAGSYFFEGCVWLGYAIYGLAFGGYGLLALLGQAIIVGSIFGVTGIPPTEAQALRSKGEAYREYQRRVSRFILLPTKSRDSDA